MNVTQQPVLTKFSTKDGAEYEVTPHGAVKQTNAKPYKYDEKYIDRDYSKADYREKADRLSMMRFSFLCGVHGRTPDSLVDVGYGAGDFMRIASKQVSKVMGLDVTGLPVPEGCEKVSGLINASAYCYHDVLEHLEDWTFLASLPAETLIVSLPNLRLSPTFDKQYFLEWFETWKHRKVDEHIHFFDCASLERTMIPLGWEMVAYCYHEDYVRENPDNRPNILTAGFTRII